MDNSAPITWLIQKIDSVVGSGAGAAAEAITNTIMPLVTICFAIYILLVLVNYLRGAEQDPVLDFMLRIAAFGIVITFGLHADVYANTVMPIVTGLGGDLANAVGGTPGANKLDQLALHYLKIINDGYSAASGFGGTLLVVAKIAIIMLGLVPFLVAAALAIIVANVGIVIVAMVGPIFFAFLLFPATRQYFSAWLNTCLSYALIPLIVAVIATISVGISHDMLSVGGSLAGSTFTDVFLASIGNLLLLFLLRQVSSLASSLSAGGINVGSAGGVGSMASGIRSGLVGSGQDVRGIKATGRWIKATGSAASAAAKSLYQRITGNNIKPG